MASKTLDERIDARRASLARLLTQRAARVVRAEFPGATVLWIGEPEIGRVVIERVIGPNRAIRWDAESELMKLPIGSRLPPCPSGAWSALKDLRMLAACLPEDVLRTKDGYLIVRLPEAKEASL